MREYDRVAQTSIDNSEATTIRRSHAPVTVASLGRQLEHCGLERGQLVIAHTSLSSLGWVCGGAVTVIEALLDVLGPDGTLVMPAHTSNNSEPSKWRNPPVPQDWWPTIRASMPAFDPGKTPTWQMGAVAEAFRSWPKASRSGHPAASFAALGPLASAVTHEHPVGDMFGERSPLGQLYALDAWILLLGVGHDSNTSLHLAEARAAFPGKRTIDDGSAMLVEGRREWVRYRHVDWDSDDFAELGADYASEHGVTAHRVGASDAEATLLRMRPLVDWGVKWLEEHR